MSSVANTPAGSMKSELNPSLNQTALLERLASHPQPHAADARRSAELVSQIHHTLEHTIDHLECPACQAADKLLKLDPMEMRAMAFADAALAWKGHRNNDPKLRVRTHEADKSSLASLQKFFGRVLMSSITAGMLQSYQNSRKNNSLLIGGAELRPWRKPAGPSAINHDLNVLSQMLNFCGLLAKIAPDYYPLPIKPWSPRQKIMSEQEEAVFYSRLAGADDEMVETAFWVALLTTHTTASGIELRGLRLENVMLLAVEETSSIYIPEDACKNDCRPRRIPLNDTARFAMANLVLRANRLGSSEPGHFVFPFFLDRGKYDPTRRAARGFLRKSWLKLRVVTGRADINPHDLRHLSITKMLEKGATGEQVRAVSGQVTQKMIDYYSHLRLNTTAKTVARIDTPNVIPFKPRRRRTS
jgi:integrase